MSFFLDYVVCPGIGFPLALLYKLLFGLVCPGIGFPLALWDELLFGMKIPGIGFPLTLMPQLWVLLLVADKCCYCGK